MKKSVILAVAAIALTASAVASAQPRYYNGYNRGYYNNNGWNYAAAAVGGALVGALVGSALSGPGPGYAPPVFAPAPVYAPPPVYYAPQACQTIRIPQYDQYGRLVQYVQTCAN